MSIWNERIHEKRIERGITLAQVAEKLGVTEATAQRYERGNIKSIPYEHMCAYGEILNCSPCYLMGWEDERHPRESPPKILQYYEMLNDIGKHEATKRVEEMTHLSQYKAYVDDYLEPDAAHPDEDNTNISLDMIQEEDNIMDDENF